MNSDLLINSLTIDWSKVSRESYLRDIPAISKLYYLEFSSPVTCFVGENGTGKSTLLEAMAISFGFNPEGGTEIYKNAEAGAQFFIATHSPVLLGIPNAELLGFDDGEIHKCHYEDTSQYQVMELFINHREQVLRHILDDSEK